MSTLLESRIRHDFAGPGPYPTLCPHKPPLFHSHTVQTLVPAPFHLSPLVSLLKDAPVIQPMICHDVTSRTILFNFSDIYRLFFVLTHGEHRIVSGDSPTILFHDVV